MFKNIIVPQQDFASAGAQNCRTSETVFTTHLQEGGGRPLRLCTECSTVMWPPYIVESAVQSCDLHIFQLYQLELTSS